MAKKTSKKVKILIIEDEKSLVDLLLTKLEKEGYSVQAALDGEEGFKEIIRFLPDLILLDVVMPKMDGYEVLEKMHQEKIKIPVIIISNSGQPVEIEKTTKLGAVDHLIKTEFSAADVLEKVHKYLQDGGDESNNRQAAIIPTPKEGENV
ncbi:MAG: response regulator, partial [Candidatus Falkowbacteria bacterium]|nr:response regulator [Candidatus Falkowbacteria bacterium]